MEIISTNITRIMKGENNMLNSKLLKIIINGILIFSIVFLGNIFIQNKVYAEASIGDLDAYNGRKCGFFRKA